MPQDKRETPPSVSYRVQDMAPRKIGMLILCLAWVCVVRCSCAEFDPITQTQAQSGDVTAQNRLGILYATDQGVAKDYAQAIVWFLRAAHQGLAGAQFNLGLIYNKNSQFYDDRKAARWFFMAANQGIAEAQNNLGIIYAHGQLGPRNYTQAIQWFLKAAHLGLAEAQFNLGILYDNGWGVPSNHALAMQWYVKAAQQGLACAQQAMNIPYISGQTVSLIFAWSSQWSIKVSNPEYVQAQTKLRNMYENGLDAYATMNYAKAIDDLKFVADQEDTLAAEAAEHLGAMYLTGR